MAIASEIIGSLNTPGYGFENKSPATYRLPKYHAGVSIIAVRWGGSDEISYDILDRETGKVVDEARTTSYAHLKDLPPSRLVETLTKGALIRFNNSTPVQVYIIPNSKQTPPVWNGQ